MEGIWYGIQDSYRTAIYERGDPRTRDWLLVYSPWYPILTIIAYNILSWNARALSKGLPAFHMRPIIVSYNFLMVLASLYMTYEFFVSAYYAGYNLTCQPVDYGNNPLALRMASVCWCYYFSKYVELLETLFFALRKKFNQISVLHVYHHSSMILLWWSGVKYVAGGQTFLFGFINSFVHAVMYTYYGMSAMGPHMQKYLWWKKYITILQLSQFFILGVFSVNNLRVECDFPTWLNKFLFVYAITLAVLFLNFYFRTYNRRLLAVKPKEIISNGNGVYSPGMERNHDHKKDR